MNIGVSLSFTGDTPGPEVLAPRCEELGFETLFVPTFHALAAGESGRSQTGTIVSREVYAGLLDSFCVLQVAAMVTRRLGLGTGVYPLPWADPFHVASRARTLALYSGGRFVFGVGAGQSTNPGLGRALGAGQRWSIVTEYVRAIKQLWSNPQAGFCGRWVSFAAQPGAPRSPLRPQPPILIGAGAVGRLASQRALRNTVALAEGWAPVGISPRRLTGQVAHLRRLCAEVGRDFSTVEISVFAPQEALAPRRTIELYAAAGARRLVFVRQPPLVSAQALERLARSYLA